MKRRSLSINFQDKKQEILPTPKFTNNKKDIFKELNIFDKILSEQKGDFTLELKLIGISNMKSTPKSSLKIKCFFN